MRIFLPFVSLILYAQSLISQNLNIAGHDGIDKTGGMVSINSKVFYLGSSENYCCGYGIYLQGMNSDGDTIFKIGLPSTFQVNYFGRIIKTNDNAILVNHYAVKSCDQSGHKDYITKVDTNGVVLFNATIQGTATVGGFSRTINDVTQHPDSSYYLVSSTDLYHYSSTGQFISKITTSLTNIVLVKALTNGKLFVSGNLNGNNTNVIMSDSGIVIVQQACSNFAVKVIETPTNIFVRTSASTLEKYDSSLTLLSSFAFTNNTQYSVYDYTLQNDSIFITGFNMSVGKLYYGILDDNFNVNHISLSNYKGFYPTGIAHSNTNKINVITTGNSNVSTQYKFSGFYQFPIPGGYSSYSDIGVVGLSNLNTSLLGKGNGSMWITPYITADVTIKNFGTDTVKSFYINHYAYINTGISPCNFLLHKMNNVNILPGGTVKVPTGIFYAKPFPASTFKANEIKLNVCIFTTIPNASNDIEIDNDSYCDSVLFTVTGISEKSLLEQSIQVYPNPSSGGFTIDSDVEIKTLELINSLGEIIKQEEVTAKEYYLNGATLSPGICFMKLETEKGTTTRKLVKQ